MMNLKFLPINATAAGDNIVVPGEAGKIITVIQFMLSPSASLNVKWLSGAVPLTGPLYLSSNAVVSATGPSSYQSLNGLFSTAPGDDLILNVSSPIVGGSLVYRISLA
jgi:hypothetical protein